MNQGPGDNGEAIDVLSLMPVRALVFARGRQSAMAQPEEARRLLFNVR